MRITEALTIHAMPLRIVSAQCARAEEGAQTWVDAPFAVKFHLNACAVDGVVAKKFFHVFENRRASHVGAGVIVREPLKPKHFANHHEITDDSFVIKCPQIYNK